MAVRSREPLTRERIVDAAVRIADADGLRAVTMRAVAEDLECEAMSLYHHVKDKRALTSGMVEAVVGEVVAAALPVAAGDWRATVEGRCVAARAVMLAHPWAPAVISQEEESPAPLFALYEALVATLIEAGFDYALAHRAIHALGPLVLGFTNELFDPAPGSEVEIDAEAMLAMASAFPHLLELAGMDLHDPEGALSTCDTEAEFAFTLRLVLDGLEARRVALE